MNWMPALHEYYVTMLEGLYGSNSSLKPAFKRSVFAATTYNLGPHTACFPHKDFYNLSFGMCAITALGNFDPKKGGHLVLWECGMVIEFPPGASILIPSAAITHSNVKVREGENRYSFTQYTAGGLFRWVENGFRTSKDLLDCLSPEGLAEVKAKNAQRWRFGMSKIPIFSV